MTPRQRPNSVEYTPLQVYHSAQAFHVAGKRCALQNEVKPKVWVSPSIPQAVNHCFASELFLKCVLKLRNDPQEGHDLKKLFDRIPETDQEALADVYKRVCPGFLTIQGELERIKDHFLETRYWYENKLRGIQTQTARGCSDALYVYCAELLNQEMIDDTFPSLAYVPITAKEQHYGSLRRLIGKVCKKLRLN